MWAQLIPPWQIRFAWQRVCATKNSCRQRLEWESAAWRERGRKRERERGEKKGEKKKKKRMIKREIYMCDQRQKSEQKQYASALLRETLTQGQMTPMTPSTASSAVASMTPVRVQHVKIVYVEKLLEARVWAWTVYAVPERKENIAQVGVSVFLCRCSRIFGHFKRGMMGHIFCCALVMMYKSTFSEPSNWSPALKQGALLNHDADVTIFWWSRCRSVPGNIEIAKEPVAQIPGDVPVEVVPLKGQEAPW